MDYEIIENTLKTQIFEVCFDHDIQTVIRHNNVYVVLLGSQDINCKISRALRTNVYGVNSCGEIIWRIQDTRSFEGNNNVDLSLIIDIEKDKDGNLFAYTFTGTKYRFDSTTGKLLEGICLYW